MSKMSSLPENNLVSERRLIAEFSPLDRRYESNTVKRHSAKIVSPQGGPGYWCRVRTPGECNDFAGSRVCIGVIGHAINLKVLKGTQC
jgi:hypothetical protein